MWCLVLVWFLGAGDFFARGTTSAVFSGVACGGVWSGIYGSSASQRRQPSSVLYRAQHGSFPYLAAAMNALRCLRAVAPAALKPSMAQQYGLHPHIKLRTTQLTRTEPATCPS
jgi:hypothetical protein